MYPIISVIAAVVAVDQDIGRVLDVKAVLCVVNQGVADEIVAIGVRCPYTEPVDIGSIVVEVIVRGASYVDTIPGIEIDLVP